MRKQSRTITAQALLSISAFALMIGFAARALQPQFEPTAEASIGETQSVGQTSASDKPGRTDRVGSSASDVFTGVIVKRGADLVLRDSSGTLYRLDVPSKAEGFEGKSVKVTGTLMAAVGTIRLDNIEAVKRS
jgi:hypothetical protein